MLKRSIIRLTSILSIGIVHAAPPLEEGSLLKSRDMFQDHYQVIREKLGDTAPAPQAEELPPDTGSGQPGVLNAVADLVGEAVERISPKDKSRTTTAINPLSAMNRRDRTGYRGGQRNPFAPTERVLTAREGGRLDTQLTLQPLEKATKLPKMHLRGVIHDEQNKLAALLELEGVGVYVVREGDTVGLYEAGSDNVIQIQKINRLNLLVKAGSIGQIIVVR